MRRNLIAALILGIGVVTPASAAEALPCGSYGTEETWLCAFDSERGDCSVTNSTAYRATGLDVITPRVDFIGASLGFGAGRVCENRDGTPENMTYFDMTVTLNSIAHLHVSWWQNSTCGMSWWHDVAFTPPDGGSDECAIGPPDPGWGLLVPDEILP